MLLISIGTASYVHILLPLFFFFLLFFAQHVSEIYFMLIDALDFISFHCRIVIHYVYLLQFIFHSDVDEHLSYF